MGGDEKNADIFSGKPVDDSCRNRSTVYPDSGALVHVSAKKKGPPLGRMRRQLLRLPPFRRLPLQIGGIQAGWSLPSPCIYFYILGSATNYVAVGSRQICNAG